MFKATASTTAGKNPTSEWTYVKSKRKDANHGGGKSSRGENASWRHNDSTSQGGRSQKLSQKDGSKAPTSKYTRSVSDQTSNRRTNRHDNVASTNTRKTASENSGRRR